MANQERTGMARGTLFRRGDRVFLLLPTSDRGGAIAIVSTSLSLADGDTLWVEEQAR
jgi:hypothetical protein